MIYLDTSAIVSIIVTEIQSAQAQDWFVANQSIGLVVSEWVSTEFASALSLKVRTSQLAEVDRLFALESYASLVAKTLDVLPFRASFFGDARGLLMRPETGLRAADALHLAIAAGHSCTIATGDEGLSTAASMLGLPSIQI